MPARQLYQFASDNTAAICPEAWAALAEANHAPPVSSYGDDRWTQRVGAQVSEIFETGLRHLFRLQRHRRQLSRSRSSLPAIRERALPRARAHRDGRMRRAGIFLAAAPSFSRSAEKTASSISPAPPRCWRGIAMCIRPKSRALSMTQATECGTVYSPDELEAIAVFAAEHEFILQMDGARFANAVASLGCAPKEITWERGVKVLSFGGTKNGLGRRRAGGLFRSRAGGRNLITGPNKAANWPRRCASSPRPGLVCSPTTSG